MDAVSVIIPTTGRPSVASTLDSMMGADLEGESLQIVVVDDSGGDDETEQIVRRRRAQGASVELVVQRRLGAAAARNRGAQAAEGELLVFCDDDVIVARDHLRLHLAKQLLHPRILVNGVSEFAPPVAAALSTTPFGRYRLRLEEHYEADADGDALDGECVNARLLSARNLGVRRKLFWELGGFDESFPYAGAEDQELSIQARASGCRLVRCRDIRVLNNEPIVTLRHFCEREERSAQTFVVLVRKHPDQAERPLFAANRPVTRTDPAVVVLKKSAKWILSRRPALAALHRVIGGLEKLRLGQRRLEAGYSALVGLHIFRGVRTGLQQDCIR
jgi:GT2 family glycosyltransferase